MAVLEKIRKRSVLLFIIIIGALLAFILGDFLNSGRTFFGPGDTIAEVGDVQLKQKRYGELQENLNNQVKAARESGQTRNLPAEYNDPDFISSQALQMGLYEGLMDREYDRMGINVTDELIGSLVFQPAMASNIFAQLVNGNQEEAMYFQQMGITDPTSFRDAIDNPKRYNLDEGTAAEMSNRWKAMEEDLERQVKSALYNQMLSGLFVPNKADALVYYANNNDQANVEYVAVPVSGISDADAKLEDADIEAVYELNKGQFRLLDEAREVAYIVQPIVPSAKDYENAVAAVNKLKADLTITDGISALASNKGFETQSLRLTADDINGNPALAGLRDSLAVGQVRQLMASGDQYVIAKITGVTNGINNVVFEMMPAQNAADLDSIFADKSLAAVDSVIAAQTAGMYTNLATSLINPNIAGGQQMEQIGVPDPNQFLNRSAALLSALETAPVNDFTIVNDTINNLAFGIVVKDRAAQQPVYETAIMTYSVFPSSDTRAELSQNLHNFVASNGDAKAFVDNAAEAGYTVRYNIVDNQSYTIGQGTPGTRSVVKWVMNADKGQVSPVFSETATDNQNNATDYLIATAVCDVYDDEFVPATSAVAKQSLERQALNDKKAKMLVEKYAGKGKTLADYSTAMGATVQQGVGVYGSGTFGNKAQGALAAAQKGAIVGPVQGNGQVYVFEVKDVKKADAAKFDAKQLTTELGNGVNPAIFRGINIQSPQLFIGDRNVTNNLLYFTPDAAE